MEAYKTGVTTARKGKRHYRIATCSPVLHWSEAGLRFPTEISGVLRH